MSERTQIRLLALALLASVSFNWRASPPAYAETVAASPGVVALTAPGTNPGQNVLFLIDPASARLMVYEHKAGGQLALRSVRNYDHELEFEQWAQAEQYQSTPAVGEINKQIRELRRQERARGAGH